MVFYVDNFLCTKFNSDCGSMVNPVALLEQGSDFSTVGIYIINSIAEMNSPL
jgi:hypothetical protein